MAIANCCGGHFLREIFFSWRTSSEKVAALDFQYVGGGCGIRDVVYLLGCDQREAIRSGLLADYFITLRDALPDQFRQHAEEIEQEWTDLYEVARLDFERFLNGWR